MTEKFTLSYAKNMDEKDELKYCREKFYIPYIGDKKAVYFLGNSLGLQPTTTQDEVLKVMENWANFGVEGFFMGEDPWMNYHKTLSPILAEIIGAKPEEIVTMNHLTVNLHLMMISFYNPTATKYKIICEAKAFPSDQYAFQSQVKMHGFNVADAIVEVHPKQGTDLITTEDILLAIEENKESVALVLFSGVNYYTGQVFDMEAITKASHNVNAYAGFDLAHAAGNINLQLHKWNVDFACWCNYKYLNSGPGAIAGAYIHEKHFTNKELKRLEGWWGNDEKNRFKMDPTFTPSQSAEAWQMSTSPMMLIAAHKTSLEIFKEVGFKKLLHKSKELSAYLFYVLEEINKPKRFNILTPTNAEERGCQVSISIKENAKAIFDQLIKKGIFADWREPNVIRVAAVPLYNTFEDIFYFANVLQELFQEK